jgi:hypothetical protein
VSVQPRALNIGSSKNAGFHQQQFGKSDCLATRIVIQAANSESLACKH